MTHTHLHEPTVTLRDVDKVAALAAGGLALLMAASRRPAVAAGLAVTSGALLYRGVTGRWPGRASSQPPYDTRTALGGGRGVHVHESIRLERTVDEAYRFWRQLDNLPRFMSHLYSVTDEPGTTRSHWVAVGPGGLRLEWDAEIINDLPNDTLAWKSLPGADVATAGSVTFKSVRGGRSTQLTVHLQYAPPAGRAGSWVAFAFGAAPQQTVREDLRRLKQLLEAGEIAVAGAAAAGGAA